MKKQFVFTIALFAVVGVIQAWSCVSLLGFLAVLSSEHRLFGLSVYTVMAAETFLAWVPISLLAGFLIGSFLRSNALAISTFTGASAFIWLLVSGNDHSWVNGSFVSASKTMAFVFLTAGIFLLLATPFGALLALRRKRPNPSFNGTPDGAR